MNPYGPGPYNNYPGPHVYANPQSYNPHMYHRSMHVIPGSMNYPNYPNYYPNQYNGGQYNVQGQQMNKQVVPPVEVKEELSPEELKKKEKQQAIEKRFDNLKVPFSF